MKLVKEPKEVDFTIKSEPWSEKDAADFSLLIQELKKKNKRRKLLAAAKPSSCANPARKQNRLSK